MIVRFADDQSRSEDHKGGEHTGRPPAKKTRHNKREGVARVGSHDQAARRHSTHGGRFSTQARDPAEELKHVAAR